MNKPCPWRAATLVVNTRSRRGARLFRQATDRLRAEGIAVVNAIAETDPSRMRRAVSRWTRLSHQFQVAALNPGGEVAENRQTFGAAFQAADPSFADLQELGAKLLKSRQGRANYVSEDLISEPAWSILLDLVVAGLKGERVATSSACAAAQVPLSTALRHVNQLIQAGWVKRVNDPNDKRRTFLELQPRYFDIMVNYLRATWNLFGTNPSRIARHY